MLQKAEGHLSAHPSTTATPCNGCKKTQKSVTKKKKRQEELPSYEKDVSCGFGIKLTCIWWRQKKWCAMFRLQQVLLPFQASSHGGGTSHCHLLLTGFEDDEILK